MKIVSHIFFCQPSHHLIAKCLSLFLCIDSLLGQLESMLQQKITPLIALTTEALTSSPSKYYLETMNRNCLLSPHFT